MTEFMLGCDPELFLRDTSSGKFVTAHGVIPGTKKDPYKVKNGAVQVDGMAVEFNTDPAKTPAEFRVNVASVKNTLSDMVKVKGLETVVQPTVFFEKTYFDSCPAEAKELGCDPDFNAYNGGAENNRPVTDKPMRTGAGHLHLSWLGPDEYRDPHHPEHIADCIDVCKQLDIAIGIPSLIWDKDRQRRSLYGRAGCFRPKKYGVEWRTLSNAWTRDRDLTYFVSMSAFKAVEDLFKGVAYFNQAGAPSPEIWINMGLVDDIASYLHYYHMTFLGMNHGWSRILRERALVA